MAAEPLVYLPELSLKRYRIDEMVGLGTAARVYRAFDLETQQIVAIKAPIIKGKRPEEHARGETFIKEYELLSHLKVIAPQCTPYMTCVYAIGTLEDSVFEEHSRAYLRKKGKKSFPIYPGKVTCVVMEYLVGHTLGDIKVRLKEDELLCVARSLFAGLAHIHSLGMIHNDIDEFNIYFTADRLLLIDFEKSCLGKDPRFLCDPRGDQKVVKKLTEDEKIEHNRKHDVKTAGDVLYFLAHQEQKGLKDATLPTPRLARIINSCSNANWRLIPSAKEVLAALERIT